MLRYRCFVFFDCERQFLDMIKNFEGPDLFNAGSQSVLFDVYYLNMTDEEALLLKLSIEK